TPAYPTGHCARQDACPSLEGASPMAYLTIARLDGEPDALLDHYLRTASLMDGVGRDTGPTPPAGARTPAGMLIVNLWPSKAGSESAATDPRRLAALEQV